MDCSRSTHFCPQRQPVALDTADHDLIEAIKNSRDLHYIKSLLECGADMSSIPDGFWTPLTLASHLGKVCIVRFLLDWIQQKQDESSSGSTQLMKLGNLVDSVNEVGMNPLMCAAKAGYLDVCQLLLQAGADVNCRNIYSGQTPLLIAIDNKWDMVVKVLLEFGADTQVTDHVGITPLYCAANSDCCEVVRWLINAGCDVNIGSQDHAPIFIAARRGFLSIVKVLCEAGCEINIANKYGVTPLYEAAIKGNNNILQYLIDRGCEVNSTVDMYNVSPLMAATMAGNRVGVEALLNAGACLRWRDSQGRCAVQLAIEMGKASILELFLQRGVVNISKRPRLAQRLSMVYSVFERGYLPTAIVLLRGCSDLDLSSLSSLSLAREHPQMLELLLTSGLTHPPSTLLKRSVMNCVTFSPECRQWLRDYHSQPHSLKSLARGAVRRSLGNTILHTAHQLPLPSFLKDYIAFSDTSLSAACVLT